MLKIKDNVDLKELENFGFKYSSRYNAYERVSDFGINIITTRVFCNNPNYKNKELVCESSVWYDLIFDDNRILALNKDLNDANIVEKVEE